MKPKKNWQPGFIFRFPIHGVRENPTQIQVCFSLYWFTHYGFLLQRPRKEAPVRLQRAQAILQIKAKSAFVSLFSRSSPVLLVCLWNKLAFALSTSVFLESRKLLRCHWRLPQADGKGGLLPGASCAPHGALLYWRTLGRRILLR